MRKYLYKVKKSLRHAISYAARRMIGYHRIRRIKNIVIPHNKFYNREYYQSIDFDAKKSFPIVSSTVVDEFDPDSVLDVGCGTGVLLNELEYRGVEGVGVEYSEVALEYCRKRNINVVKHDLEKGGDPLHGQVFDVVISMEVTEHIPNKSADQYIKLICNHGSHVIFTAATPGQGGQNHINEQPHEYWIRKFHTQGFSFLERKSLKWRKKWEGEDVSWWFVKNLMLFRQT